MLALSNKKREFYKLFVHSPTSAQNPRVINIINKATELQIPIDFYDKVYNIYRGLTW